MISSLPGGQGHEEANKMSFLARQSIRTKALVFCLVFLAVIVAIVSYAATQLRPILLNGPIYHDIMQGRDLLADAAAPRLNLTESYLLALRISGETDADRLVVMIDAAKSAEASYHARFNYWASVLSKDGEEMKLLQRADATAGKFFNEFNGTFIGFVLEGKPLQARAVAEGLLAEEYRDFNSGIEALVVQGREEQEHQEKAAAETISRQTKHIITAAALAGIVVGLIAWYSIRSLSRKLAALAKAATLIGQGDVDGASAVLENY
jgi:methyl-accepting chemotaxis protein